MMPERVPASDSNALALRELGVARSGRDESCVARDAERPKWWQRHHFGRLV
jgi:hypothetical protein